MALMRSLRYWVRPIAVLALLAAFTACQKEERTEVVVVVDSDYAVPTELDAVVVEVVDPDGGLQRSIGNLAGPEDLPAMVGLVHEGGPLGPYEIVAVGRLAGESVVSRRALFTFIERQILSLPMHLVRSCEGETCPTGQTCTEDGCADEEVSGLRVWSGSPERLGGGDGDADGDVDGDVDGDGDGDCGPEIDLQTDPENCGECGYACEVANGTPGCEAGACTIDSCNEGFDNCNFNVDDGCEADLSSDAANCNGCGLSCRAGRVCCDGECADSC